MFSTSDLIELFGVALLAFGLGWAIHPGFGVGVVGAYLLAVGFAAHDPQGDHQ